MLEQKIQSTLKTIERAFAGVSLGNGVSWREADVIDSFGSQQERAEARLLDEKDNWKIIPDELIDGLRWQAVLSFMDDKGLRFHIPACMCFTLRRYKDSDSTITESTIYHLCVRHIAFGLKKLLTAAQAAAVADFLSVCLEIEEGWLPCSDIPVALAEQWKAVPND